MSNILDLFYAFEVYGVYKYVYRIYCFIINCGINNIDLRDCAELYYYMYAIDN